MRRRSFLKSMALLPFIGALTRSLGAKIPEKVIEPPEVLARPKRVAFEIKPFTPGVQYRKGIKMKMPIADPLVNNTGPNPKVRESYSEANIIVGGTLYPITEWFMERMPRSPAGFTFFDPAQVVFNVELSDWDNTVAIITAYAVPVRPIKDRYVKPVNLRKKLFDKVREALYSQ